MPPIKTLIALALAGLLTGGVAVTVTAQEAVDPAIAAMSVPQLIEARQGRMRENGGILRQLGGLSGAEASAAATTLIRNFTDLKALYPEGSIATGSKALPTIWEDRATFDAILDQAVEAARNIKAAVEAGDAAGVGAGAQVIGGLCGQCHQKFRA
jgi:cytochrome c556